MPKVSSLRSYSRGAAALVTGAGARLGAAMAIYLGGRGYDVAVHYATSADGAETVVRRIGEMGRRAVAPRHRAVAAAPRRLPCRQSISGERMPAPDI